MASARFVCRADARPVVGVAFAYPETAELLGVTIPTVKTRLHRARLALREAITRYFEKG